MEPVDNTQAQNMRRYYQWHATVYDATRWTFLFGRKALLHHLPAGAGQFVVEVGCGTGHNIRLMARRHPDWRFAGIDVSPDMLAQASKATATFSRRVQLFGQPYGAGTFHLPEAPDVILFSYALTMFNPGWEAAIEQAWQDLKPGGHIAVVDFHDTPAPTFRWWMQQNHVRMDGHLLPVLEAKFRPVWREVHSAWGGICAICCLWVRNDTV